MWTRVKTFGWVFARSPLADTVRAVSGMRIFSTMPANRRGGVQYTVTPSASPMAALLLWSTVAHDPGDGHRAASAFGRQVNERRVRPRQRRVPGGSPRWGWAPRGARPRAAATG